MIRRLMEKLLYLTWRGASPGESRCGVEHTEERIEERRKTRIGVNADITITHPDTDDFERWMGRTDNERGDGARENSP